MNTFLDRSLDRAATLSRWGARVAGGLLIASVLLISFDVIGRKVFGMASAGSNELSGYVLAISTSWALAFGVFEKINVRVDLLYQKLPLRLAAAMDILAVAVLEFFIVVLTYYAFITFQTSLQEGAAANTDLGTPLWIPQGLWVLGMIWMTIVLALVVLRASASLIVGDVARVTALCGPRGSTDEAEEEARLANQRTEQGGA
ncbi:TRAP transporter small permease subunit [Castellaniella sp.]|uniref:TRAP transporter small permease subunit n=1 Tax=Castellaniella sp. TaxID=1955812 RepID=UPI003C735E0E